MNASQKTIVRYHGYTVSPFIFQISMSALVGMTRVVWTVITHWAGLPAAATLATPLAPIWSPVNVSLHKSLTLGDLAVNLIL